MHTFKSFTYPLDVERHFTAVAPVLYEHTKSFSHLWKIVYAIVQQPSSEIHTTQWSLTHSEQIKMV